jgi:hypothetical protein
MTNTPPITPPAIAPTFGPLSDVFETELVVEGAMEADTQVVDWHASHVGGISEQIWSSGHAGQDGVSLGHPRTHRRKRVSSETVGQ